MEERRLAAEARERSQSLRKAAKAAEAEVAQLTQRRSAIDRALFDPAGATGADRNASTSELMRERGELDRKLADAEAKWLAAEEAVEAAQQVAA